jgi:hypothetical protein
MKKLLSGMIVFLVMSFSWTANAGLISFDQITDGEFTLSSGAQNFSLSDLFIDLTPPAIAGDTTGDFVGFFPNSASYTLDDLNTSGGQFTFTEFWDFSNGVQPLFLSLVVDYTVDLFTADVFEMSGTAKLVDLNTNDILNLDYSGSVTNQIDQSGLLFATFIGNFSTLAQQDVNQVSESKTIGLFVLALVLMVLRSKQISITQLQFALQVKIFTVAITGIKVPNLSTMKVKQIFAANTNTANDHNLSQAIVA